MKMAFRMQFHNAVNHLREDLLLISRVYSNSVRFVCKVAFSVVLHHEIRWITLSAVIQNLQDFRIAAELRKVTHFTSEPSEGFFIDFLTVLETERIRICVQRASHINNCSHP